MASEVDDWLKTPGIAHTSVKALQEMGRDKREWRAVMLGFGDYERDRRIGENHARLMNNLKDRYADMKRAENGDVKEEKKIDGASPDSPSFGTTSSFCDKKYKPGLAAPAPTPPPSTSQNQWQQRGYNQHKSYGRPKPPRTKAVIDKTQQPVLVPLPVVQPIQPMQQLQQQAKAVNKEMEKEIGLKQEKMGQSMQPPPPPPLEEVWMLPEPEQEKKCNTLDVKRDLEVDTSDMMECCTSNASNLNSRDGRSENEEEGVEPNMKNLMSHGITFEMIPTMAAKASAACANKTYKEKVRRYDKEPTAAGKRYLRPIDRVENSEMHQLLTQVKFDKKRVKKWVGRFNSYPPSYTEEEEFEGRPRRYSDPPDNECTDSSIPLIVDNPVMDEDVEADEVFQKFHRWMMEDDGSGSMHWPLEDSLRVDTPEKGDTILVRVVDVCGRRATIAPHRQFKEMEDALRDYVDKESPSFIPSYLSTETLVIVEQEGDTIGESEYRRGWMYQIDGKDVKVLLMDERRIVSVDRTRLHKCPPSLATFAPPLCIAAEFEQEPLEEERNMLIWGCLAQCRIMEKEVKEEGGRRKEILKLCLDKIKTNNRTLDVMFCSEECAGACEYHRKKLKN